MEQTKLNRINELARASKERELSASEKEEQKLLCQEYIQEWRASTIAVLENTYVVTPDGKKHKLKKKDGGGKTWERKH